MVETNASKDYLHTILFIKLKYLYTCRSTDDILKKSWDYLQVKVCRLCKLLAQVLAQIRTRSGLENINTNWFTSDSELKVGLQLTALAYSGSLRSSYTLQFIMTCISFSRTLQNGHKRASSGKPS